MSKSAQPLERTSNQFKHKKNVEFDCELCFMLKEIDLLIKALYAIMWNVLNEKNRSQKSI